MTSRDFCFWLQGYLEIGSVDPSKAPQLDHLQMNVVRQHLAMVFKHEIDPSMGDKKHQDDLNKIHVGGGKSHPGFGPDKLIRC
jgi:hypothetical protein